MTPGRSVAERVWQATARELLAADSGELDDLVLAYPTTTRKSQGSEYPAVVIPFSTNTSRYWSSHAEIAACLAQVVRDPILELAGGGRRIRTTGPSRDRADLSRRTGMSQEAKRAVLKASPILREPRACVPFAPPRRAERQEAVEEAVVLDRIARHHSIAPFLDADRLAVCGFF